MALHRSTFVPPDLADYAAAHSSQPDAVQLDLIARSAEATGAFAGMQIGADQGVLMEMLARLSGSRSAIEIGTFTGYSSLAIARGIGPDGCLLCCDISTEWTDIAREHWERAGVADRIELRIGPALETLAALAPSARFDLAFIDADKTSYLAYLEALVPRLEPGALVMVDNTLWSGAVIDASATDADTVALRAFNDAVVGDDRFNVALLAIGDGLTLLERR